MSTELIINDGEPQLPALPEQILPALSQLTESLGIPREVLAPDAEIAYAWRDLPRELAAIPPALRDELIARMCVAVSAGLFDGAINYAWNATILHLRQKFREFGLPVIAQTLQKDFEERHLLELQDSQLLELGLRLGLISEDGFFFLDQCRDTRNNFSAAHPTIGKINDREFTTFLNRCIRYALAAQSFPRGIDVAAFINAVKGARFNEAQRDVWIERLDQTHDAQRQLLFTTSHGIYCDPASAEESRQNALDLCVTYSAKFTSAIRSSLVERHADYTASGDTKRQSASLIFFEKLGLLTALNDSERHGVVSKAIKSMWTVHQGMDNFYNEPPFAERLLRISQQGAIPETVQEEYVNVVVGCRIGNGFGVSRAAVPFYDAMIKALSPREIGLVLGLARKDSLVGRRIQAGATCNRRYREVLSMISRDSVPSRHLGDYDHYVSA